MDDFGITVKDLERLLATHSDVTLLDVRRGADYASSPAKIPGARWRDPEKIDQWCAEFAAGQSIVVYCVKGGSVSQAVTERLLGQGCDGRYLKGGLKAWSEDGQTVS